MHIKYKLKNIEILQIQTLENMWRLSIRNVCLPCGSYKGSDDKQYIFSNHEQVDEDIRLKWER